MNFIDENTKYIDIPDFNSTIIWLDTETTGLDRIKNNIIQLGIIITHGNRIIEKFDFKIRPPKDDEWTKEAEQVHGISYEEARNYPAGEQVVPQIARIFSQYKRSYIGGHNVIAYDNQMLTNMFKKYNIPILLNNPCIDTKLIANEMEPKGKGTTSLQNLCKKYNIPVTHAHEAMSDIYSSMNYWLLTSHTNKTIPRSLQTKPQIFNEECFINPVNCVGVMGKGLAFESKKYFPENYHKYKNICQDNKLMLGKLYITPATDHQPVIINFPTKQHWKDKSSLEGIRRGLKTLANYIDKHQIYSIGIPALGCGCGGLSWHEVEPEIHKYLDNSKAKINLYPPHLITLQDNNSPCPI